MKFEQPLIEGIFLKRYKRFFADVLINGETVVAHVPNTGSLKSCNEPESRCLLSPAQNPERKLKFTLEMIRTPKSWVGVNTANPAELVRELWLSKRMKHWSDFDRFQSEVKINSETRLDGAMWDSQKQNNVKKDKLTQLEPPIHFIEIKNVTLAENGAALFPDAVTERGQKHLHEMMKLLEKGFTCEMIYVIQREDCKTFSPADAIDPEYGKILRKAVEKGLLVSALPCHLNEKQIVLSEKSLPIEL